MDKVIVPEHVSFRDLRTKVYQITDLIFTPIEVTFSRNGVKPKTITVKSKDKALVEEVKMKIQSHWKPSHFISIPFAIPVMKESFEKIKDEIKKLCPDLDEALFQVPERLHLFLGLLYLSNAKEEAKAKEALQTVTAVIDRVVGPDGLKVSVEGLGRCMDDSDSKKTRMVGVRVISDHLPRLEEEIFNHFKNSGLKIEKSGPTIPQITFINHKFKLKQLRGQGMSTSEAYNGSIFDSTKIIEKLSDFVFAKDIILNEVHISCLKRSKDANGYYMALDKVSLNIMTSTVAMAEDYVVAQVFNAPYYGFSGQISEWHYHT